MMHSLRLTQLSTHLLLQPSQLKSRAVRYIPSSIHRPNSNLHIAVYRWDCPHRGVSRQLGKAYGETHGNIRFGNLKGRHSRSAYFRYTTYAFLALVNLQVISLVQTQLQLKAWP